MRYTHVVVKVEDIDKLPEEQMQKMYGLLNLVNAEREKQGKPINQYAIVNLDEPYAGEVVEIMKRNGHWDDCNPGILKRGQSINDLVKAAHENAISKGCWDEDRSFGEIIALIHSEASEALEDFRNGKEPAQMWYERKQANGPNYTVPKARYATDKPCGIPSELADIVIRVMDACGRYGINLERAIAEKMAFNATRPQRHGGKVL
ncbi:hypothetical protein D3C81_800300 [compost metagenome]